MIDIYAHVELAIAFLLFLPLNIFFTALLFNYLHIRTLRSKIKKLAKPIFCATLQSIIVVGLLPLPIFLLMITQTPIKELLLFSALLILSIVTLILSIVYSRAHLNKKNSVIAGILLCLLTLPMIYIFILVAGFIYTFAGIIFVIIALTIIQAISMRRIIDPLIENNMLKGLYFFTALGLSNFLSFITIKYLGIAIKYLSQFVYNS